VPSAELPQGYRLVDGVPAVEEYLELRRGSGLTPKRRDQAAAALAGSWAAVHVVCLSFGESLLVLRCGLRIEGGGDRWIEISGARDAGVDLRAGARVTLSNSLIRDNEGHGVIVRARAEPRLERNVIIHNGHGAQRRAGVVVEAGASPELEGNGIGGNGGEAVQGWPAATLLALAQRNVLSPAPEPQPETVTVRPARPTPPATARPRPRAGTGRE